MLVMDAVPGIVRRLGAREPDIGGSDGDPAVTTMPLRRIGPFTVSAVGYGAMGLSANYGRAPARETSVRLLNRALDLGITMLDTAAVYGGGDNERLLADAVGHRRHEFVLATKGVLHAVDGARTLDGSPAAIARSLDASLRRLRSERIDLYYLHRLDDRVPIEDSVGALVRAVEAGKIGGIGLSEMSAATLRRAHAVHPIAAMQSEYSPTVRNPEIAVLETCRELGTGFVAFSPTARGLLAGGVKDDRYDDDDVRKAMPRFVGENLRSNLAVAARFAALAAAQDRTPAQLSIAWVLSRAEHIVPIFGTGSERHLEENAASATVALPGQVIAEIDAMFAGAIEGSRYNAKLQSQIDTETFADEVLER